MTPGPPDAFASRADKLRFLLQAPEDAAVVLQGGYWQSQRSDFSAAGFRILPHLAVAPGQPGYLFLDTRDGIGHLLPTLAACQGQLMGVVAAVRVPRVRGESYLAKFSDRLRASGLGESTQFEVDALGSGMDELRRLPMPPPHSRGLRKRLQAFRRGPLPHLSFFGPTGTPGLPGLHLAETEAVSMAAARSPLRAAQVWFRRRGALVIRLDTGVGAESLFLRVATNSEVDAHLSGNQRFVDHLLATPSLSAGIRALIPTQLGHRASGGAELYLEAGFAGQMAWTLETDPDLRARIEQGLYRFSTGLQREAGHRERLSGERLTRWITDFLGPLPERLRVMGLEDAALDGVVSQIHRLLDDRNWWLAPAHGDFGSGNALARSDGRLTGVIDWDTHAEDDLAGLDWCDHRLKALRFRKADWPGRLGALIEQATTHGMLAPEYRGFGRADFGLDRSAMVLLPCLAYLRILIREARYPSGLRLDPGAYRRALAMVGRHLAAAPDPEEA